MEMLQQLNFLQAMDAHIYVAGYEKICLPHAQQQDKLFAIKW